ncbi:MAG: hypothetical protein ACLFWM_05435 [Actinomycetota bacterium]
MVQGGVATTNVELSHDLGLTCVVGASPPPGIVIVGLPGCLLGENVVTVTTTVLTEPGDYTLTFREQTLLGEEVDSATFQLTVEPLVPDPPPTSTTTTASTSTITTTSTSTTTTLEPQPTSTTTTPTTSTSTAPTTTTSTTTDPSTTTTAAVDPTTTTTTTSTSVPEGTATTTPPTTVPPASSTTSVVTGDPDDDDGGGAASDRWDSGLPPPAPLAVEETEVESFLTPFLPGAVAETLLSPLRVLEAMLRGAFDTAGRIALLSVVLVGYSLLLVRRWRTSRTQKVAE